MRPRWNAAFVLIASILAGCRSGSEDARDLRAGADSAGGPAGAAIVDPGPDAARALAALVTYGRDRHGPLIAGGAASRRYCLQGRDVFFLERPPTAGIIQYAFVLAAFDAKGGEPVVVVASEKSTIGGSYFLTVTDADGRANVTASEDWADREKFLQKALEEIALRLEVPNEHEDVSTRPAVRCADLPKSTKPFVRPKPPAEPKSPPADVPGATVVIARGPSRDVSHLRTDVDSIYWIESDASSDDYPPAADVWRIPKAGGSAVLIATQQRDAGPVETDATHVYWPVRGAIVCAPKAGGAKPKTTVAAKDVHGFTKIVLAGNDIVFVAYEAGKALVRRAPKSGGAPAALATLATFEARVRELAVDETTVYVATAPVDPKVDGPNVIYAIPRAGGRPEERARVVDHAISNLVVSGASLFWTAGSSRKVYRLDKGDGSPKVIGEEKLDFKKGLSLVQSMRRSGSALYLYTWSPTTVARIDQGGGPIATIHALPPGSFGSFEVDTSGVYLVTNGSILRLPP